MSIFEVFLPPSTIHTCIYLSSSILNIMPVVIKRKRLTYCVLLKPKNRIYCVFQVTRIFEIGTLGRSTIFFLQNVYMGRLIELGNSIKYLKKKDLGAKKSVFMHRSLKFGPHISYIAAKPKAHYVTT